jgi:hypothetical protein
MSQLFTLLVKFIITEFSFLLVRAIESLPLVWDMVFGMGVFLDWSVVDNFFVGGGIACVLL